MPVAANTEATGVSLVETEDAALLGAVLEAEGAALS
jgi:hypothetical protein